jgi:hypothetical protein
VATALWVTMEMEKHVRQARYAPIFNVPTTACVTKTRFALNIQTVHRYALVNLATMAMGWVQVGVLLEWIHVLLYSVKTVVPV